MYLNDFDVLVFKPSEVAILVGYLQKRSTVALQGTDKQGAEVIIKAWNDALLILVDDVNCHFDTSGNDTIEKVNRTAAIDLLLGAFQQGGKTEEAVILESLKINDMLAIVFVAAV